MGFGEGSRIHPGGVSINEWLLNISTLLYVIALIGASTYLPRYAVSLGASETSVSLLASSYAAASIPLVPRWSLFVIGINLFVLLCFLTHRDVIASLWSSRDFHLPQRDHGISMGSLVAVEPSGTGLPSMLGSPKPFWA